MTPRTQEKIKENLGLLMDFFAKKYGHADEEVEYMLVNALTWTAHDVAQQQATAKLPPLARVRQWFRYRGALHREVAWINRCDRLGDLLMGCEGGSWRGRKIAEAKTRLRREYSL